LNKKADLERPEATSQQKMSWENELVKQAGASNDDRSDSSKKGAF
jgi:hypothetical protein